MTEQADRAFRLGDWLVEPHLNRLSRSDSSVMLEPRTMALLVMLYQRAGEVVSSDEIIEQVWQGRPMGDNPVYKAIAKLRQALGDDPKTPRYIATVSKKGYRLIAGVATDRRQRKQSSDTLRRFLAPLAIGVAAGVALSAAFLWDNDEAPAQIRPVSTFSGSHSQPSFGPDGNSIAFVSDADGTPHIWVFELGESSPRQVTFGDSLDSRPRFAPNGETILFERRNSIWMVDVDSGEVGEVVRNAYHPNWSWDGQRIVYERRYEIWVSDADGGKQQPVSGVAERELPLAPRWPAYSPDGGEIVYFDSDASPMGDLWVVPAAGGVPKQLTDSPAFGGAPTFSPDGRTVYYSSQRAGSRTLWRVEFSSGKAEPLLISSGDDDFPDVSADGKRLVYSNSREHFYLLRSDPDSGTSKTLHESRLPLIAPEISPDGTTIVAFGGVSSGGMQIISLPIAGGTTTSLTRDPRAVHAIPRWSADGRSIYFFHSTDHSDFARLDAVSGELSVVASGWDWNTANGASVSPDQSRIAYSRLDGQTPVQTMLRHLDSSNDISFHATLEYPRWTRDGGALIGSRHVDQRFPGDVVMCRLDAAECDMHAEGARIPMLSVDESTLYFVRGFGRSQTLHSVPIDGSTSEHALMTMEPLFPLGPFYDIADDGTIVWVRHETDRSDIWIVDLTAR